jgi:hypothetical protein
MSQVHSRFNGCVDIGAVRARSGRVAALAALKVAFFPLANDENEVMTRWSTSGSLQKRGGRSVTISYSKVANEKEQVVLRLH